MIGIGEVRTAHILGSLTAALGLGAIFPRPGIGLYSILGSDLFRASISLSMIVAGVLTVWSVSRAHRSLLQSCCLILAASFQGYLLVRFVSSTLWGAAGQSILVIYFAVASASRIWRAGLEI